MARSRDLRNPMIPVDYIVYVVDDDVRVREALRELFTSLAVPSAAFGSHTAVAWFCWFENSGMVASCYCWCVRAAYYRPSRPVASAAGSRA